MVTTVVCRITKKDALHGSWREFICGGGEKVRIAQASEDTKMIVGSWFVEEMSECDFVVNGC